MYVFISHSQKWSSQVLTTYNLPLNCVAQITLRLICRNFINVYGIDLVLKFII